MKLRSASENVDLAHKIIDTQDKGQLIELLFELTNYHHAHESLRREQRESSDKLRSCTSETTRQHLESRLSGISFANQTLDLWAGKKGDKA